MGAVTRMSRAVGRPHILGSSGACTIDTSILYYTSVSEGNLRATTTYSSAWLTNRVWRGHSSGKRYYEIIVVSCTPAYPYWQRLGVIQKSGYNANLPLGSFATDVAFDGSGNKWLGTSQSSYGAVWGNVNGNVAGFAIDLDLGIFEGFVNGKPQGQVAVPSFARGEYFPATTLYGNSASLRYNFGSSPFLHLPHGYTPWDWN